MHAKDAVQYALTSTQHMVPWYLSDLSDADLLVRPVAGANHIAWQMGHLIGSEVHLLRGQLSSAAYPDLPRGWQDQHDKKTSAIDPPKGFAGKEEYLSLFNKVREATIANLSKLSDADLDRPCQGDMAKFAPTLGAMFMLIANHTLMHTGQFTVVRRKLGKPVLF